MTTPTEAPREAVPEPLEVVAWKSPMWRFYPTRFNAVQNGEQLLDALVRLSDAESAIKARDSEIEQLRGDAARMDWLMQHTVNVRVHLRYGSTNLFWAGPEEGDGEILPSDLRTRIDQAIARGKM